MRACLISSFVVLFALSAAVTAQIPFVEGQLFIADRGTVQNGSAGEIRRYTQDGTLIETLQSAGSGAIRGIETDFNNDLFVARGNGIEVYRAPMHTPDTTFATGFRSRRSYRACATGPRKPRCRFRGRRTGRG